MSTSAIVVEGLTKRFGKKLAVDGLSFQVEVGRVCGFLGRNGAGKTTTIRMLVNLMRPSAGKATVLGLDPRRQFVEVMQRVGYVGETPTMHGWMKVRELAWFTAGFYDRWDRGKVASLLERFGIDPEQQVKHLSRGTNAQLALALALGHNPELLILDEPSTGLDPIVRRDFLEGIIQLIQEEGRTVLLSSHLVHEVERVADQIVVIEAGKLVTSESVESLKRGTMSLEEAFVELVGRREPAKEAAR
jgi:ABC-2 type transport system ATP-binding protein